MSCFLFCCLNLSEGRRLYIACALTLVHSPGAPRGMRDAYCSRYFNTKGDHSSRWLGFHTGDFWRRSVTVHLSGTSRSNQLEEDLNTGRLTRRCRCRNKSKHVPRCFSHGCATLDERKKKPSSTFQHRRCLQ